MASKRRQSTRITRTRATRTATTPPTAAGAATPSDPSPDGRSIRTARRTRSKARGAPGGKKPRPARYRRAWGDASDAATALDAASGAVVDARLDEVPHELLLRAAREKFPWIRRFVREGFQPNTLMKYARLYAEAEGIPEADIPSYSTLNTWAHRYAAHDMIGLVDAGNRQAGQSRTITGELAKHLETAVLNGKRAKEILHYFAEVLPPGTELPKYPAVYRALKAYEQREPLLIAMVRMGPTWFRDHCEEALSHGIFPGGLRLTIDSTVADAWVKVWIKDAYVPFRPVLTVVEDVGSRILVTFNLSLHAIDSGICLGVLGRALNRDLNYEGLPSVGVPHEITLDKGAEHQRAFREKLDVLGIEVVKRRDNSPRGGAHVESLIGSITKEVFKNLPVGYSACERPFDAYAPADRDVKRTLAALNYDKYRREVPVKMLLTLQELEARIWGWAMQYNMRPHVSLPVDSPELQAQLKTVQRVVGRQHPFAPDAGPGVERVA